MSTDPLYTVAKAAEYLSVSESTVWRYMDLGEITWLALPPTTGKATTRKSRRISLSALEAFKAKCQGTLQ